MNYRCLHADLMGRLLLNDSDIKNRQNPGKISGICINRILCKKCTCLILKECYSRVGERGNLSTGALLNNQQNIIFIFMNKKGTHWQQCLIGQG